MPKEIIIIFQNHVKIEIKLFFIKNKLSAKQKTQRRKKNKKQKTKTKTNTWKDHPQLLAQCSMSYMVVKGKWRFI